MVTRYQGPWKERAFTNPLPLAVLASLYKVHNMESVEVMTNTQTLIARAYSAFNHRDINSALALMSENISWPKASEGGRVMGKEEIRAYWTRQWQEFDPHVEPLDVIDQEGGITEVKVHQLVKRFRGCYAFQARALHMRAIVMQAKAMEWKPLRLVSSRS
jgi:hypothetical protein